VVLAILAGAIAGGNASSAVRIIGGTPIQIQASPTTVYVQYQDGPNSYYRCAGTIIDATHVVTAGLPGIQRDPRLRDLAFERSLRR
jgi:hypothetical protein